MEMYELIQLIRDNKLMKFYKSREWRELRLKALKRDNFE
ncbi:HNH endonuclease, partial [Bacillus wiedmannii]